MRKDRLTSQEQVGISLDYLIANPSILTGGMSYRQVLERARSLLSDQDRWAQGVFARDRNGVQVKPRDPNACCWCLLGAIAICSNELGISPPDLLRYLDGLMHFMFQDQFSNLGELNDYVSHELIIEFLDDAIARFG